MDLVKINKLKREINGLTKIRDNGKVELKLWIKINNTIRVKYIELRLELSKVSSVRLVG